MTKQTKTELTTASAEPTAIAVFNPNAPTGFEDFDMDDLIVPRLNLLQDLSKTVKAKTATAGKFQNNLTEEQYDAPLEMVFIQAKKVATYLVMGEGLKCKSVDRITSINGDLCKNCPFGVYWDKWVDDERPGCSAGIEVFAVKRDTLLNDIPNIMLTSFSGSSLKLIKQYMSKVKFSNRRLYDKSVVLSVKSVPHPKGEFYNYVLNDGTSLHEEEHAAVQRLHQLFISGGVTIHEDQPSSNNEAFKRPQSQSEEI